MEKKDKPESSLDRSPNCVPIPQLLVPEKKPSREGPFPMRNLSLKRARNFQLSILETVSVRNWKIRDWHFTDPATFAIAKRPAHSNKMLKFEEAVANFVTDNDALASAVCIYREQHSSEGQLINALEFKQLCIQALLTE